MLALVHGSGYERISTPGCSDRTIRRRVKEWSELGISEKVHALALEAYDRVTGLGLGEISVDGWVEPYAAICRGHRAGLSMRALERKYGVTWRTIRKALDSSRPEPRRKTGLRAAQPCYAVLGPQRMPM